jgi:hypothetical protein
MLPRCKLREPAVATETRTETTPEMTTPMWTKKGLVRAEAPGFEPGRGFKTPTALAVRRHRPD